MPVAAERKHRSVSRRKLPVKRTINLAQVGEKKANWTAFISTVLIIILLVGVCGKFLVYDRIQDVFQAESEREDVRYRLNEGKARLTQAKDLNEIFAHYTFSGMTEEEKARVSRTEVAALLDRVVAKRTKIDKWTVSGNTLTLDVGGDTLQEINETVQLLMEEEIVSFCTVSNASTVLQYMDGPGTPVVGESVIAKVLIYLQRPTGEGDRI